ncbi:MAG: hypothetical protein ACOYNB_12900 [Aquabacterium sp.]|uniref:hypothetical protein n=1 Tax=Aquabacterium sp. TaxID=1872578 RepID=UPI003BC2FB43
MAGNDSHGAEHAEEGAFRRAQQVQRALSELNARIATLSTVLHIDLSDAVVMQSVLQGTHPAFGVLHQHQQLGGERTGADKRHDRTLQELQGLLALRCDLMTATIGELGLSVTQDIVQQVQDRREQEGLRPDADGFHLRHLLKPDVG